MVARLGRLDVLVNAAGMILRGGLEFEPAGFQRVVDVNLAGTMRLETRDAPPRTIAAGELALVPRGEGHTLRSEAGVDAPDVLSLERELVSDRYEVLRHGALPLGMLERVIDGWAS